MGLAAWNRRDLIWFDLIWLEIFTTWGKMIIVIITGIYTAQVRKGSQRN